MNPECPLKGTRHEASCCLIAIMERLPEHMHCPFQQDCREMLEDEQRALIKREKELKDEQRQTCR